MSILEKITKHKNFIVLVLSILPLVPIGFYVAYFYKNPISKSSENWGQFGDYMGGVINPIFGFISVILLIYTILQQQKALSLQEEELKATREELARSAKAQEESEKALNEQAEIFKQQQFEATFFSLFNQLIQINNNLLQIVEKDTFEMEEYNIYYFVFSRYKSDYYFIRTNQKSKEIEWDFNYLEKMDKTKASELFLKNIQKDIDTRHIEFHQFSLLLYQALKLINLNNSELESRKKYSNILRAAIDIRVLQILAVSVCRLNSETYRPYINLLEENSFFEHMPFKLVKGRDFYKPLLACKIIFSRSAFGESIYIKELEDLLNQQQAQVESSPTAS
jgi:hypothetical protein